MTEYINIDLESVGETPAEKIDKFVNSKFDDSNIAGDGNCGVYSIIHGIISNDGIDNKKLLGIGDINRVSEEGDPIKYHQDLVKMIRKQIGDEYVKKGNAAGKQRMDTGGWLTDEDMETYANLNDICIVIFEVEKTTDGKYKVVGGGYREFETKDCTTATRIFIANISDPGSTVNNNNKMRHHAEGKRLKESGIVDDRHPDYIDALAAATKEYASYFVSGYNGESSPSPISGTHYVSLIPKGRKDVLYKEMDSSVGGSIYDKIHTSIMERSSETLNSLEIKGIPTSTNYDTILTNMKSFAATIKSFTLDMLDKHTKQTDIGDEYTKKISATGGTVATDASKLEEKINSLVSYLKKFIEESRKILNLNKSKIKTPVDFGKQYLEYVKEYANLSGLVSRLIYEATTLTSDPSKDMTYTQKNSLYGYLQSIDDDISNLNDATRNHVGTTLYDTVLSLEPKQISGRATRSNSSFKGKIVEEKEKEYTSSDDITQRQYDKKIVELDKMLSVINGTDMKFISWNVKFAIHTADELDKIKRYIDARRPDILFIQENPHIKDIKEYTRISYDSYGVNNDPEPKEGGTYVMKNESGVYDSPGTTVVGGKKNFVIPSTGEKLYGMKSSISIHFDQAKYEVDGDPYIASVFGKKIKTGGGKTKIEISEVEPASFTINNQQIRDDNIQRPILGLRLRDKTTKKYYVLINVHSEHSRDEGGATKILTKLKEFITTILKHLYKTDDSVIISGDFNEYYTYLKKPIDPKYDLLNYKIVDGKPDLKLQQPEGALEQFTMKKDVKGKKTSDDKQEADRPFDLFFHNGLSNISQHVGGGDGFSDHFPIIVDFKRPDASAAPPPPAPGVSPTSDAGAKPAAPVAPPPPPAPVAAKAAAPTSTTQAPPANASQVLQDDEDIPQSSMHSHPDDTFDIQKLCDIYDNGNGIERTISELRRQYEKSSCVGRSKTIRSSHGATIYKLDSFKPGLQNKMKETIDKLIKKPNVSITPGMIKDILDKVSKETFTGEIEIVVHDDDVATDPATLFQHLIESKKETIKFIEKLDKYANEKDLNKTIYYLQPYTSSVLDALYGLYMSVNDTEWTQPSDIYTKGLLFHVLIERCKILDNALTSYNNNVGYDEDKTVTTEIGAQDIFEVTYSDVKKNVNEKLISMLREFKNSMVYLTDKSDKISETAYRIATLEHVPGKLVTAIMTKIFDGTTGKTARETLIDLYQKTKQLTKISDVSKLFDIYKPILDGFNQVVSDGESYSPNLDKVKAFIARSNAADGTTIPVVIKESGQSEKPKKSTPAPKDSGAGTFTKIPNIREKIYGILKTYKESTSDIDEDTKRIHGYRGKDEYGEDIAIKFKGIKSLLSDVNQKEFTAKIDEFKGKYPETIRPDYKGYASKYKKRLEKFRKLKEDIINLLNKIDNDPFYGKTYYGATEPSALNGKFENVGKFINGLKLDTTYEELITHVNAHPNFSDFIKLSQDHIKKEYDKITTYDLRRYTSVLILRHVLHELLKSGTHISTKIGDIEELRNRSAYYSTDIPATSMVGKMLSDNFSDIIAGIADGKKKQYDKSIIDNKSKYYDAKTKLLTWLYDDALLGVEIDAAANKAKEAAAEAATAAADEEAAAEDAAAKAAKAATKAEAEAAKAAVAVKKAADTARAATATAVEAKTAVDAAKTAVDAAETAVDAAVEAAVEANNAADAARAAAEAATTAAKAAAIDDAKQLADAALKTAKEATDAAADAKTKATEALNTAPADAAAAKAAVDADDATAAAKAATDAAAVAKAEAEAAANAKAAADAKTAAINAKTKADAAKTKADDAKAAATAAAAAVSPAPGVAPGTPAPGVVPGGTPAPAAAGVPAAGTPVLSPAAVPLLAQSHIKANDALTKADAAKTTAEAAKATTTSTTAAVRGNIRALADDAILGVSLALGFVTRVEEKAQEALNTLDVAAAAAAAAAAAVAAAAASDAETAATNAEKKANDAKAKAAPPASAAATPVVSPAAAPAPALAPALALGPATAAGTPVVSPAAPGGPAPPPGAPPAPAAAAIASAAAAAARMRASALSRVEVRAGLVEETADAVEESAAAAAATGNPESIALAEEAMVLAGEANKLARQALGLVAEENTHKAEAKADEAEAKAAEAEAKAREAEAKAREADEAAAPLSAPLSAADAAAPALALGPPGAPAAPLSAAASAIATSVAAPAAAATSTATPAAAAAVVSATPPLKSAALKIVKELVLQVASVAIKLARQVATNEEAKEVQTAATQLENKIKEIEKEKEVVPPNDLDNYMTQAKQLIDDAIQIVKREGGITNQYKLTQIDIISLAIGEAVALAKAAANAVGDTSDPVDLGDKILNYKRGVYEQLRKATEATATALSGGGTKSDDIDYILELSIGALLINDLNNKLHKINGYVPYSKLNDVLWEKRQVIIQNMLKQLDETHKCIYNMFDSNLPESLNIIMSTYFIESNILELSHLMGNVPITDRIRERIKSKIGDARLILKHIKEGKVTLSETQDIMNALDKELTDIKTDSTSMSYYNNSKQSARNTINNRYDLISRYITDIVEHIIGTHVIQEI